MTAIDEQLRAVLSPPFGEAAPEIAHHETEAAVLVPLFVKDDGLHVVFTKRREDLRRHPGEISFPGGRRDHDGETLAQMALREAHEEIGLPADAVELVGTLAPVRTFVTGYVIFPHVGLIAPGREWVLSPEEVALVLELSLQQLVDGYAMRPITRRGFTFETDTYVVGDHLIWGATARILGDLLRRLDEAA